MAQNAGFETDENGIPKSWEIPRWYEEPCGSGISRIFVDRMITCNGKGTLQIQGNKNRGTALQIINIKKLQPGSLIKASGRCRALDLDEAAARIYVEWWDDSHKDCFGGENIIEVRGTGDWTCGNKSLCIPRGATQLWVYLMTDRSNSGFAWFDDIFVGPAGEKKDAADKYLPAPEEKELKNTPGEIKQFQIQKASSRPVIDGKLDDQCWKDIPKPEACVLNDGTGTPREKTDVYLTYDDKNLYVAFKCYDSQINALKATQTQRDDSVWLDDSVEIFLDVDNGARTYYHFIVNPLATRYDAIGTDWSWNGNWQTAVSTNTDHWMAEIEIPFSSLDIPLEADTTWGLNFCRGQQRIPEWSAWSPTFGSFHTSGKFGKVLGLAPDINHYLSLKAEGKLADLAKEIERLQSSLKLFPPSDSPGTNQFNKDINKINAELFGLYQELALLRNGKMPYDRRKFFAQNIESLKNRVIILGKIGRASAMYCAKNGRIPARLEYGVGIAGPLDKIFKDRIFEGEIKGNATVSGARGEYEGFQVVLLPFFGKELKDVSITVTDLIDKKTGAKIDKSNLQCNRVDYVKTRQPIYTVDHVGWWPDPLFPLRKGDVFSVTGTEVQPVWVTMKIPENAVPGEYYGEMLIQPSNSYQTKIELSVKVWNFTLTRENHLTVFADLNAGDNGLTAFYNDLNRKMFTDYAEFMLEHRVGTGWTLVDALIRLGEKAGINLAGPPPYNYPPVDEIISRLLGKGLDAFGINRRLFVEKEPYSQEYLDNCSAYIKEFCRHLKEKGWLDKAFIWVIEEPPEERYANSRTAAEMVKKACPELRRAACIVSRKIPEIFIGQAEIWAVNLGDWDKLKEELAERQKCGETVWWITNAGGKHPYPNFFVDYPAIDCRIHFWMAWKYKIDGVMDWSANSWGSEMDEKYSVNLKGARWPEKPWDAMTYHDHNGDGYLIYPGPDKKPLSSIRFEVIRDGIEDYEYLWILKQKISELKVKDKGKQHASLLEESEKLLNIDESVVASVTSYTKAPQDIYNTRDKIASRIEDINDLLKK